MLAVLRRGQTFADQVDSWVHEAVRSGVRQFDELLRWLPGVYPVDAAASVRRLRLDGRLRAENASRLLAGTARPNRIAERRPSLPAPHPLDSDWRFTPRTSATLLREARIAGKPGDAVVCLGTPSVYQEALQQGEDRRAALVDANAAVIGYFSQLGRWPRVWRADLLSDPIPPLRSSAVVADPPWYWDEMAAFLWAASQTCTLGGHVFMPMPPKGTRPGVAAEVGRLMELARAMGFYVTRFEDGAVQYDSPPFERNALQAAGIRLVSYDWRRADLCVLRLLSPNTLPRPAAVRSSGRWAEEELLGTRVRLRRKAVGPFADPTLASLVTGDVLPSVSRRHPMRRAVDVWTTGNRVFSCTGTSVLRTIIRALARGQDPALRVAFALGRGLSGREKHLIDLATEQVKALAGQEQRDFCFAGVG